MRTIFNNFILPVFRYDEEVDCGFHIKKTCFQHVQRNKHELIMLLEMKMDCTYH